MDVHRLSHIDRIRCDSCVLYWCIQLLGCAPSDHLHSEFFLRQHIQVGRITLRSCLQRASSFRSHDSISRTLCLGRACRGFGRTLGLSPQTHLTNREANRPSAKRAQLVCHDTLPWLIPFSLDAERSRGYSRRYPDGPRWRTHCELLLPRPPDTLSVCISPRGLGAGRAPHLRILPSAREHMVSQRHGSPAVCSRLAVVHPRLGASRSRREGSPQPFALVRAHLERRLYFGCRSLGLPCIHAKHLTRRRERFLALRFNTYGN